MRIAFVCGEYPPFPHGGIGTFTAELAEALVALGHEVRVTGLYRLDGATPEHEVVRGVSVERIALPTTGLNPILARPLLTRRLTGWALTGQVDLIEAPDFEGMLAGLPLLPVPTVARLHGSITFFAAEMGTAPSKATWALERTALNRADFIAAITKYCAGETNRHLHLHRAPDAVLPNSVAVPDTAGLPWTERAAGSVVFAGSLLPKKGVETLARAWPLVLARVPGARLSVFGRDTPDPAGSGGGPSMQARMVAALGDAAPTVTFHGHRPREEVLAGFAASRVAVFPSLSEAFGLVPFEAMSRGAATIYTQAGCGPELLKEGEDALLVDPKSAESVAAAIVQLLTDDGWAQGLAARGRAKVEKKFDRAQLVKANVAFYEDCCDRFRMRSTWTRLKRVSPFGG